MSNSPLYKTFKTNAKVEHDGIDLQYGETQLGTEMIDGVETPIMVPVTIRIARAGGSNVRYDKVFEAKTKPYKRQIQTDSLDKEVSKRLIREVYAETVILGWENVQNADGDFLDFTVPNVLQVLKDLPDLFNDIVQAATNQSLWRADVVEADAKN